MRCTVLATLLAAAGFGILPVAAGADPPWSPAASVGPVADYVEQPSIAFWPDGVGALGWLTRRQPAGAGGLPGAISVTYKGGNDGFAGHVGVVAPSAAPALVRSVPDSLAAPPALYGHDRALVLRSVVLSSAANANRRVRLSASIATAAGALSRAHELTRATLVRAPALAADPRGDAVAAWVELTPKRAPREFDARYRVRVAQRSAGGRFGRAVTLLDATGTPTDHGGQIAAGYGADGTIVVVYANRRTLDAFVRRPGHGWSTRRTLGANAGFVEADVAVGAHGRAVVAWGTQDGGEEANRPWVVRAAFLPAGHSVFRPAQVIDPGGAVDRPAGTVAAALGADGRGLVTWSGVALDPAPGSQGPFSYPVRVAASDGSGRFGAYQGVAPSGAAGDAAIAPDGGALVTWAGLAQHTFDSQDGVGIFAALRAAGADTFTAPEAVAPGEPALDPRAAFDPVSGVASVVWAGRPGGHTPANGVASDALLRLARRGA